MAWMIFRKTPRGQNRASEDVGRMTVHRPAPRLGAAAQVLAAIVGTMVALALGAAMILTQISSDYGFVIVALAGLCGLVVCDSISRRGWEREITARIRDNMDNHNRLAGEVARNRGDIAALKDGLSETAMALENHARSLPAAAAGIESRILKMIAGGLGGLGGRGTGKAGQEKGEFIELELAPPPRKPPPESRAEEAMRARTNYTESTLAGLVQAAVQQDKMAMFVQPVVSLPQRRIKMVETLARIRTKSGNWLHAERYMRAAANDSLLPVIDDLLLLQCLNALNDPRGGIPPDALCILNIDGATLYNKGFMADLTACLARNRTIAARLVFELPQAALDTLSPAVMPVLDGLARLGCRFSMDSVRKRRIDMARLKALKIRYLKLDAAWLIREANMDGGAARVSRLKKQLDAAGIDLIVERIEKESDLRELLDFGIGLGQGYLFSKPELYEIWREKQNKMKKPVRAA